MFKKFSNHEQGITGLETAIILIAFVVVAAVFAYTVLSAGLFATQKTTESIYSGLKEAQSSLVLKGGLIATANTTGANGTIKQMAFVVGIIAGGEPIDFTPPTANTTGNNGLAAANSSNKVVISYVDDNQEVRDLYWTLTKLGKSDGDNFLEENEKFEVTVGANTTGANGGNLANALNPPLRPGQKFNLLLMTQAGAVLQLERTMPGYFDPVMNLR
jgi:flagellin FlaB